MALHHHSVPALFWIKILFPGGIYISLQQMLRKLENHFNLISFCDRVDITEPKSTAATVIADNLNLNPEPEQKNFLVSTKNGILSNFCS